MAGVELWPFADLEFAQGETLLLEPGGHAVRQTVVDGGGEVLLARLEPVDAAR